MSWSNDSPRSSETTHSEQERRLYESILSSTPDLICVFDRNHRIRYANPALAAIWGRSLDEMVGQTFAELGYEPELAALYDREIEQAVSTKEPVLGEAPCVGPNGRRVYDYIFAPIFGASGEVETIAGTTRDVTKRKRKEEMLQFLVNLNETSQSLANPEEIMAETARVLGQQLTVDRCAYAEVQNENEFVITGDYRNGVPSIVGRWKVAAFGKECERQMLANEAYVVADTDTDPRIGPADLPAYRATNIRAVICVPLHKAGKFTAAMAVHQTASRVWTREEIQLVELVVARCWESLERARAARSLRQSEKQLRFMAESMPQKIFTTDASGAVDYVNPQWMEFSGRDRREFFNRGWLDFIHPDERAENSRRWKHAVETGEPFKIEHRFRRHDGEYRWHLTRARPMRDPSGRILLWIGSVTDIEDQKQAKEKLEQTVTARTAELREIIGELEAFSYSIAHDLRAPLRALQGFSEILLTEHARQLDAEGLDFLRRIATAAERMDKLINDVLTYSRAVRGDSSLERIQLEPLLRSIVETYPMFVPQKADVVLQGSFPAVLGNEAMLTQIFSNLLGNAVKFVGPNVKPRIRVWVEPVGGRIRLFFRDNGIGIEPEKHRDIFRIFEQADRSYGGTGIGLSIVKKAVERMGGDVGVSSEPGRGSTFWIDLQQA